jgi:hypothetical protein
LTSRLHSLVYNRIHICSGRIYSSSISCRTRTYNKTFNFSIVSDIVKIYYYFKQYKNKLYLMKYRNRVISFLQ